MIWLLNGSGAEGNLALIQISLLFHVLNVIKSASEKFNLNYKTKVESGAYQSKLKVIFSLQLRIIQSTVAILIVFLMVFLHHFIHILYIERFHTRDQRPC